jgi:hypothetical protein
MSSVLALPKHEAIKVRGNIVKAARLCVENRSHIEYTEGYQRWYGISHKCRYQHGKYPLHADCSAITTWYYWTTTRHWEDLNDFINGEDWTSGYTGTQVAHGKDINANELKPADLVFYGGTRDIPAHVAVYIGPDKVISHGGLSGDPQVYPLNLYGVMPIIRYKRYIVEA